MTPSSISLPDTAGGGFDQVPFSSTSALTLPGHGHDACAQNTDAWRTRLAARLAELERLAPNWDTEGALPVARRHANRAMGFADLLLADIPSLAMPEVVPLSDGGVQLEWHTPDGGRVDFITDDDADPSVLLETPDGSLEEFASRDADLSRVRGALGR